MKSGSRLKEIIEKSGMTQKEFAFYLGVSASTLNGYIRSSREPDLDLLMEMARVLNVTIDFLLDFSTESKKLLVLNKDEATLINSFRNLSNPQQQTVFEHIDFLLWQNKVKNKDI